MNKRVTYFNNEKNISGKLIQDLRKKFNLSVEDLAIKNKRTVTDFELLIIARVLNISIIISKEEIKYIDSAMLL